MSADIFDEFETDVYEDLRWRKSEIQNFFTELKYPDVDIVSQQILEKARDGNTELHKCFTWDDTEAAEKWRISEARSVVRNLKIVEVKPDKEPEPTTIRVFYKTDSSSGYKPTKLILKKPDEYKALVERCRSELLAVKQKFQNVSEYEEIWEMIN